ncbi:hypothetical protein D3C85_1079020 [compost metagenome]
MHWQDECCENQHKEVHRVDARQPGHPEVDSFFWSQAVSKVFPVDIGQDEARQNEEHVDPKASGMKQKSERAVWGGKVAVSDVKKQD